MYSRAALRRQGDGKGHKGIRQRDRESQEKSSNMSTNVNLLEILGGLAFDRNTNHTSKMLNIV